MSTNRVIGLIGPSASGKTQFKVFLLARFHETPRYIARIFDVMQYRESPDEVEFKRTSYNQSLPSVIPIGNEWYYQRHRPTKKPYNITIRYRRSKDAPETPYAVTICDFPGEFCSPTYWSKVANIAPGDGDEALVAPGSDLSAPEPKLESMDELIFIVPFWSLLAPEAIQAVVRAEVLEPALNDRIAREMHDWIRALQDVHVKVDKPPRLTIALSQCGGRVLTKVLDTVRNLSTTNPNTGRSIETLDHLIQVAARLGQLERRGSAQFRDVIEAIRRLRQMERAAQAFLRAGHRARNSTAQELVGLADLRPEMLAFNVVDDEVINLTVGDDNQKATVFPEKPLNAHLVLARFWQNAARDLRW